MWAVHDRVRQLAHEVRADPGPRNGERVAAVLDQIADALTSARWRPTLDRDADPAEAFAPYEEGP